MTITEFIAARLDEAEMHAKKDLWCAERASGGGKWEAHYGCNLAYSELWPAGEGETIARFTAMPPWPGGRPDGAEDQHQKDVLLAARMASGAKPRAERTLRQVAALRAILGEAERAAASIPYGHRYEFIQMARRHIAAIWADHPDYDQRWKP